MARHTRPALVFIHLKLYMRRMRARHVARRKNFVRNGRQTSDQAGGRVKTRQFFFSSRQAVLFFVLRLVVRFWPKLECYCTHEKRRRRSRGRGVRETCDRGGSSVSEACYPRGAGAFVETLISRLPFSFWPGLRCFCGMMFRGALPGKRVARACRPRIGLEDPARRNKYRRVVLPMYLSPALAEY